MIVISRQVRVFDYEFKFSFSRSSGPGGQNVNKVNSRASLKWNLIASPGVSEDVKSRFFAKYGKRLNSEGELTISSDTYRDQIRNKQNCVDKLTEMLRSVAKPPKRRRPTKPTRGSKERRLDKKKKHSDKKKLRANKEWD